MDRTSNRPNFIETSFAISIYFFAFSIPVSIVAAQAAAVLVLIGSAALGLSRHETNKIPALMSVAIPAFLLLVVISSLLSSHPGDALSQLKKSWVMLCFFPMILYSSLFSRQKSISFLIAGTALGSAIALLRFFFGGLDRAAPYSGGYTTLALFIAAVFPFVIWRYARSKSPGKWIYVALSVLMAAALVFTKTRAGWLAALVAVIIMGFSMNIKRSIIGLSLFAVLIAIIPQTRRIISDRFNSGNQGGFSSGRMILYENAVEPLSKLPFFGYGPGSFSRLVSRETLDRIGDPGVKSWHSTPLEILIESGPVTLMIFMIIAFIPVRRGLENLRNSPGEKLRHSAVLASLAALYLAGLTTNLMRDFMVLSLLVFLWSAATENNNRDKIEIIVGD